MDSKFTGPMGFRFGLDGIIGLVPVVGDFIGIGISLFIVYEAAMLGCSPSVLLRMGVNILVESVIEMIPILGSLFDFVWKANNKNILLIETHLLNPRGATVQARLMIGFIALTIVAIFIGSISITVYAFQALFSWISS